MTLGQNAANRQLEILQKINSREDELEILCDDEITLDHDDLLESKYIEQVDDFETFAILQLFNPSAFRITKKGKAFLESLGNFYIEVTL